MKVSETTAGTLRALVIVAAVLCLLAVTTWTWDGRGTRDLTYEQARQAIAMGRNPGAAAVRLSKLVHEAIADLEKLAERNDHDGLIAKDLLKKLKERRW